MAKRDRFYADKTLTITVNDVSLEYLEDLGRTGLYGNTYNESAALVFQYGLNKLIESGTLKIKDKQFPRDE